MANRDVGWALGGAAKTYSTISAAFAASSTNDNIRLYYSDANDGLYYSYENVSTSTTTAVGVEGMIGNRQVGVAYNSNEWYYLNGDLSGISSQLQIKNITFDGFFYSILHYNDTSGTGAGYQLTNCHIRGGGSYAFYVQAALSGAMQMDLCIVEGLDTAVRINNASTGVKLYHNFLYGGRYRGVYAPTASTGCDVRNNLVMYYDLNCLDINTAGTCTHNVASDATATGEATDGGGTSVDSVSVVDLKVKLTDGANSTDPRDLRGDTGNFIYATSGTNVGISADMDGTAFAGGYPIGPTQGISYGGASGGGGSIHLHGMIG